MKLVSSFQFGYHALLPVLVAVVGAVSGNGAQLFAITAQSLWRELILWEKQTNNYIDNYDKPDL